MTETYDNDLIREIDGEMGWVEEDGSCPSKTADEQGYDCKFLEPWETAWRSREDGVWSCCHIATHETFGTTLLAKSFGALKRLNDKFLERHEDPERWEDYYSDMWERRYKLWCCKDPEPCECQLCRMSGRARSPEDSL